MENNMAHPSLKVVENSTMDKQKALEAALGQIERAFGKGSIMKLGEQSSLEIEAVSSGSLGLDIAPVSYTHLTLPTTPYV